MAGDELLLSIDCGTQSVRALLFDLRGKPVAQSQLRLDGYATPQPGWHEHDVDAFWQQVAGACCQLWRTLFRLAGASSIMRHLQREAEAKWWAAVQPQLWAQTHKLLLVSGRINWKLTGGFVGSARAQVAYLPFDFKKHTRADAGDWKWQAVAVRRRRNVGHGGRRSGPGRRLAGGAAGDRGRGGQGQRGAGVGLHRPASGRAVVRHHGGDQRVQPQLL